MLYNKQYNREPSKHAVTNISSDTRTDRMLMIETPIK